VQADVFAWEPPRAFDVCFFGFWLSHVPSGRFDAFWQPFTLAVGPAGHSLHSLPAAQRAAVRDACRAQLPDGPFTLPARAWYAGGLVRPPGGSPARSPSA